MGVRSKRYSMIVEDGVVKSLNVGAGSRPRRFQRCHDVLAGLSARTHLADDPGSARSRFSATAPAGMPGDERDGTPRGIG